MAVKKIFVAAGISLWILGMWISTADAGRSWKDHKPPYDFLFGNHIDTHQETRLEKDGDLSGFFYITYTGKFTPDGLPIAKHCDADTPPKKCVAGWILRGERGLAKFVFHSGNDHPIWLVDRTGIPQPDSYAHFHWLDAAEEPSGLRRGICYRGYFLELQAIESFAFEHGNELIPVRPGIDIATHVNIVASFPDFRPPRVSCTIFPIPAR
jgi:hypothetical protein